MTTMSEQSIRNGALLKSGTPSPNPWDLTLSGQNGWHYNEGTRTEDRAPQGCDPSAASSAGMARAVVMLQPPEHTDSDPSEANLLRTNIGLDKGVHLTVAGPVAFPGYAIPPQPLCYSRG